MSSLRALFQRGDKKKTCQSSRNIDPEISEDPTSTQSNRSSTPTPFDFTVDGRTKKSLNSQYTSSQPHTLFEALEQSNELPLINLETQLQVQDKIAEGGAAVIHVAQITDQDLKLKHHLQDFVIVKILKQPPNVSLDKIRPAFQQEVAIMWVLRTHRHFINILGYNSAPMTFVMRYTCYGSLLQIIQNQSIIADTEYNRVKFEWPGDFLLDMALDMANALSHMHSIGIVHQDIKPANVLLDWDPLKQRFYALLCDFGIAIVVGQPVAGVKSLGNSKARGVSPIYAAPEVFQRMRGLVIADETPAFKCNADVYAYGIVLFELSTRLPPWPESIITALDLENAVMRGERPQIPAEMRVKKEQDKTIKFLWGTMECCWLQGWDVRPEMSVLYKTIGSFRTVARSLAKDTRETRTSSSGQLSRFSNANTSLTSITI